MPQFTFTNPVALPEQLNAAERKFVQHMAAGIPCSFDKGENANVIHADLIRFFAWGGSKDAPIRGNIIALQGARVSGVLNLENVLSGYALALTACHFDSPVKMSYSKFRGVNLDGSHLMESLLGGGMEIDRDMFMNNVLVAKDGVDLLDADIGGNLYCNGGEFRNKGGPAITASRLKVGGDLHMGKRFSAEGGVRLLSATIGGGIYLKGGAFNNKNGYALVADGARVRGNFIMGANKGTRFCANGGVSLIAADIAGDLICRGAFIKDIEDYAFIADGVKVGGSLRMNSYKGESFHADGDVLLVAAHIGVNWTCRGGTFNGEVAAEHATIGNSLFWQNVGGKGECNLSFTSANVFDYDEKSLHGFEFILDGFSYKRFAEHKSAASHLDWLESRPEGNGFSPQPFEQAAKVLFAMGQDNDARKILLEKEKQLTKQKSVSFWRKPWRWLWDIFAGYGHRPGKTLFGMLAFVIAGAYLFDHANESRRIVPHQPVVLRMLQDGDVMKNNPECAGKQRPTEVVECLLPEHPKFHALVYSLDVFIPAFALHQESHWYPQPKEGDTDWRLAYLRVWYWIEIIAGWVLTSLLVLTITGLLKPRQSSLE